MEEVSVSVRLPKDQALEFKARLGEHGQISRAVRKFVRIFIMMARDSQEKDLDLVISEAAAEAARKILEGGL